MKEIRELISALLNLFCSVASIVGDVIGVLVRTCQAPGRILAYGWGFSRCTTDLLYFDEAFPPLAHLMLRLVKLWALLVLGIWSLNVLIA